MGLCLEAVQYQKTLKMFITEMKTEGIRHGPGCVRREHGAGG